MRSRAWGVSASHSSQAHWAAAGFRGKAGQCGKMSRAEQHRACAHPLPGKAMDAPRLALKGLCQCGQAGRAAQGLVALADQAAVHAFHISDAQADHIAAVLPVVQQAGDALRRAQLCHLGPVGNHQNLGKHAGRQTVQSMRQQRPSAQVRQQLVGAKAFALTAGQDQAADLHGAHPSLDG